MIVVDVGHVLLSMDWETQEDISRKLGKPFFSHKIWEFSAAPFNQSFPSMAALAEARRLLHLQLHQ